LSDAGEVSTKTKVGGSSENERYKTRIEDPPEMLDISSLFETSTLDNGSSIKSEPPTAIKRKRKRKNKQRTKPSINRIIVNDTVNSNKYLADTGSDVTAISPREHQI